VRPIKNDTAFAIIALALVASVTVRADTIVDRVEQARRSVVQLRITGRDSKNEKELGPFVGSAFAVYAAENSTFLITAAHVIETQEGWFNGDAGILRTIRVYRETDDRTKVSLVDEARLIAEDKANDVAVLELPGRAIPALPVATTEHLRQLDQVAILGYPASEGSFVPKLSTFRRRDPDSTSKLVLADAAAEGQSGGPIVDADGRAIGVASENDDRRRAQLHFATIVSIPVQIVNQYLEGQGLQKLAFASVAAKKLAVIERTGKVAVSLSGTTGDLAKNPSDVQSLAFSGGAHVQASGGERSEASGDDKRECDESKGRRLSSATAMATIDQFELTGLKFKIDLMAQGGSYRTAVICIAKAAVGLSDNATKAVAVAHITGEIKLQASPSELFIVWQNLPSGANVELLDPTNQVRASFPAETDGEKAANIDTPGIWRVKVKLEARLTANGPSVHEEQMREGLLYLESR
jgi:S1-C subfamily serine protease